MSSQHQQKVANKKAIEQLIAQQKYKSVSTRIDIPQPSSASSSKQEEFGDESQRSLNSSQKIRQILNEKNSKELRMPLNKNSDKVQEPRRQLSSNLSMDQLSELKSHREMLHQQLETLDYSKIIVPVNIGVKYRPPKIGIEFYLQNNASLFVCLFVLSKEVAYKRM